MKLEPFIIFDLDGVLVDTTEAHAQAYIRLFGVEGVPFTYDDFVRVGRGTSRDAVIRKVLGEQEPDKMRRLMQDKVVHTQAWMDAHGLKPIHGALEFVQALRERGHKLAVATMSRTPDLFLEASGLAGLFDVVIDRNQVTKPKPDPEIFLRAAEEMGAEPAQCLVIEDAPVGIEAALAAGMRVLALSTTTQPEGLQRAEAIFSDLASIKAIYRKESGF